MFKAFKKISFPGSAENRLVYKKDNPEAPPTPPEATPAAEALRGMRLEVDHDFYEKLDKNQEAVRDLIRELENKKYQTGDWKEWNKRVVDSLGVKADSEKAKENFIIELQNYISSMGAPEQIKPDGRFGPNSLSGLKGYMAANEPEHYGWQPAITKAAFFTKANEPYYLTHKGEWVDMYHKPVDPKLLVKALKANSVGNGYFQVATLEGKNYYIDRHGKSYANLPQEPGPRYWLDEDPYETIDNAAKDERREDIYEGNDQTEQEAEPPVSPGQAPEKPKAPEKPEETEEETPVAPDLVAEAEEAIGTTALDDVFPGGVNRAKPGPIRRTGLLAEDIDKMAQGRSIDTLRPEEVAAYMRLTDFENIRFRHPDHWFFNYQGMEGAFQIVNDHFFQFTVNKPEKKVWGAAFPPKNLVGHEKYVDGDLPKILALIKKQLNDFKKGGYGKEASPV